MVLRRSAVGATLVWPAVAVLGFLLVICVVVALGTTSTARYEFERNGANQAARTAVHASPNHPAGSRTPARSAGAAEAQPSPQAVGVAVRPAPSPGAARGWWLLSETGRRVAGPFEDRIDAEWAALAQGLSAVAVYGVRCADGTIAARPSPDEQAWFGSLGEQLERLPEDWDGLLTETDPLTTLVVEIAAALVEAGLPLADPTGDDPSGGVVLFPEPATGGVLVSWTPHDRMSRHAGRAATAGAAVLQLMNETVADVLVELGFLVEPYGSTGCCLVTALR
jgi:hypothetical protein